MTASSTSLTAAAIVARMLTNAARRSRQRIVHDDRFKRVLEPAFLVELEEARDVHVQRTAVLARRQRQVLTDAGAAALGLDVVLEFVVEVAQRGEDRIRRSLAEPAQRRVADHPGEFVQLGEVLLAAFALGDARQRAQRLVEADPARRALAARLGAGELDEVAGDVDHAIVVVHHHHAARAHDRAELAERFVVDRRVEQFVRDATAGRTAGLHRLDRVAAHAAGAGVVDEARQRRAERHFDQAGVLHFADQRKDLGAGAGDAAGLGEPSRPLGDDRGDVEPGFDVVDVGRTAPQALFGRERRARPRPAGASFERTDQRRFFAADEGAGALDQIDVELEAAPEDVVAEDAVVSGLREGHFQPMDGERIFGADIDDALLGAGDVAADRHALDQRMGIAFEFVAIHIGAGVAFIGVADQELAIRRRLAQELPFQAGRETGAAAAAQPRNLELLVHQLRRAVDQHLVQRLVAADRDIFFDVVRIDQSAVAQDDLLLSAEERNLVPHRNGSDSRRRSASAR